MQQSARAVSTPPRTKRDTVTLDAVDVEHGENVEKARILVIYMHVESAYVLLDQRGRQPVRAALADGDAVTQDLPSRRLARHAAVEIREGVDGVLDGRRRGRRDDDDDDCDDSNAGDRGAAAHADAPRRAPVVKRLQSAHGAHLVCTGSLTTADNEHLENVPPRPHVARPSTGEP